MTTQYTPILKIALPVTGELSGTWGDVVNDNITSMFEQAIAGLATINTWTANAHTLTSADGTTSESRCAMLVAADGAGLSAAGEIICPAASKLYVLKNGSSYALTLKTSGGSGVAVAAGETAFLFCDGTNVNSCVTTIVDGHITGNLTVDGNATINGNTTLGNATSDTITATARFASGLTPSADNTYDLGSTGNSWKDLYIDGTAYLALVDINGGTIDGVSIGATTAATIVNVDNLRLDGNTLSSTDTNGNVVIAPNGTGDVQLDADTVRVGDSGAAATLTSNGAGALTVTTGGAANLVLSTNSGTDSGTITIANGANGNITLTPNGTGDVALAADTTILGDANTDTYLTTNGTGNLNLTTNGGTNSGVIQIAQGANGNITLTPNGTGAVSVPKFVVSTATSGRVPYTSTGGLLVDSANLQYSGTDLTVYGITVGRGAGAVVSNTTVGASALAANTTGTENTALGGSALVSNTTGSINTAVGFFSLYSNTSGQQNSALGTGALTFNTTGSYNTAVGREALRANTTASNNTAVGYQAGYSNTTGAYNTAFGPLALYTNSTASANVAIGYKALYTNNNNYNTAVGAGFPGVIAGALEANTTGTQNVAVGSSASGNNSTGSYNVAVGVNTLSTNSTGSYNVAIGNSALNINTASGNTAVGYQAALNNTTATDVVAIGTSALFSNQTASRNVAVGQAALYYATSGPSVAMGWHAGYNVTTGTVTALGYYNLVSNTTGSENVAVGGQTMYANTTGGSNVAIGDLTLGQNTTASGNTAIGGRSMYSNTTGASNVALGYQALYSNTTASDNTAVGYQAGYSNTTGNNSAFLGYQAGYAHTTGAQNVAIGDRAMSGGAGVSGNFNNAIGAFALRTVTSGTSNTAIGNESLFNNTTASDNTAVGYQAGYSNTTGSANVLLGKLAGFGVTTGAVNTFVGTNSGDAMTTGSKNLILGRFSGNQGGLDIRTANNNIVLSDGDGNPRMFIDGSGRANIGGTSATAGKLVVDTSGAYYATDFATALFREASTRATVRARTLVDDSAEMAYDVNGALRWMWSARPSASSAVGYDMNLYRQASTPSYTSVSSEIITFQQNGNISLPFGWLQFPATQNASSNANTLDDYEEGTWTPTINSYGGGTATYGQQSGTYTKIGRVVTVSFYIDFSVGTLASGSLFLGGLPFSGAFNYQYGSARFNSSGSVTAPASGLVGLQLANGSTSPDIQIGTATGVTAWTQANLDPGQDLIGTFTYITTT